MNPADVEVRRLQLEGEGAALRLGLVGEHARAYAGKLLRRASDEKLCRAEDDRGATSLPVGTGSEPLTVEED
jgi:hypothetical protein